MRTRIAGATIFFAASLGFASLSPAFAQPKGRGPSGPGLTLTSPDFEDGGIIPNKYTQAVPDAVSPKLEWTHVPKGTESFALILHDPDVAIGRKTGDVLHWMIFNIPGTATGLPQGVPAEAKLPDGAINAKNLRGGVGYMGPGAPAAGPNHHYTFELFALDTKLDLGPDATRDQVLDAMQGHILGKGVLEGRFHK
ncbi:MAG TPA: YbhB/YbcL family Raf kinase inhibitor-like protein [Bryobacteraceae bacterium]|nr:YbhB/YbcL family Raf kinase inhibitor-like protein [Bryobacteraceae bacterium]